MRKRLRKKLHAKYVGDVRTELSMSSYWRRRLFAAPPGERLLLSPAELRRSGIPHRWVPFIRYPLRYMVEVGLPNHEGFVEFAFRSAEFPALSSWSQNNSAVI